MVSVTSAFTLEMEITSAKRNSLQKLCHIAFFSWDYQLALAADALLLLCFIWKIHFLIVVIVIAR